MNARRVLIVDDSPTARRGLRRVLEAEESGLRVVGEAASGAQALRRVRELRPDVVTMDVFIGDEDGVALTSQIMSSVPCPIVLVTSADVKDRALAFRAMQAGALDLLPKPRGEADRKRLVRVVRALSRVPVVTRRSGDAAADRTTRPPPPEPVHVGLVAIGASTGGPPLLHDLLQAVPAPLPVPVLVVQHIIRGFAEGLAKWLEQTTGHEVLVCRTSQPLVAGKVYVAPDDAHLVLSASDVAGPSSGGPRRFQLPSIDELFESVAHRRGSDTMGVLLSGMGEDGARGLLELRLAGALTVAQDPSTCVVDSMPSAAIRMGAAGRVLRPSAIARLVQSLADVEGRGVTNRKEEAGCA